MLGSSPEEVAQFLARTDGLDKTTIGDYLGERWVPVGGALRASGGVGI